MFSIEKCPIPAKTILDRYLINGAYADSYSTEISWRVPFPEFIFAFYTTPLFKLERFILKIAISKPSTDLQARQLADGLSDNFAAWHIEDREENEILMCDFRGQTRSWLMAVPLSPGNETHTRLYFGSAVVPKTNPETGKPSIGPVFQALLGFHQIYSMLLLSSAKSRLTRRLSGGP